MRFGIIGLGRMGANLALSALGHGHQVVGHDRDADVMGELACSRISRSTTARCCSSASRGPGTSPS
jgi:6-phosphogluconate dehydrogenase (decarboxylating)